MDFSLDHEEFTFVKVGKDNREGKARVRFSPRLNLLNYRRMCV